MTPDELDELERTDSLPAEEDREQFDDENRLKAEFVRSVSEALEDGDEARVYELVEPLNPADIADLFELVERDERAPLATAISDLMTGEVIAELNDHVR
ncbi:MAG: magnesium transporter, partial [Novosphingobium sp.]|nr:magnesium transporter [Novosphingobium sp.]